MRDNAWVKAVGEIQRDVAISHLWLEEHVSGDEVDVAEISARLERSRATVGVMLGERRPGPGESSLEALVDEDLLARARELERQITEFRRLSELRRRGFESSLRVGIGSPLDVEYDAVFGKVLARARAFEAVLEHRRSRNSARSRLLFMGILAAWGALIAVAALGLWNRELHRRRAASSSPSACAASATSRPSSCPATPRTSPVAAASNRATPTSSRSSSPPPVWRARSAKCWTVSGSRPSLRGLWHPVGGGCTE